MSGCPDQCLCAFDQDAVQRTGIDVEGLGTSEAPFYVQPGVGRAIPAFGTSGERLALVLNDSSIGMAYYETDSGRTWLWTGALNFGWQLQTAYGIHDKPGNVAITSGVGAWQDVCTLSCDQGAWALWAKANVEASVEPNPVTWSFRIFDVEGNQDLDLCATSGVFEDTVTPITSILRPVALQDLVVFQETHTVKFSVARSSLEGSQLLAHPHLMGIRLPLPFAP